MYIKRHIEEFLNNAIRQFPAVLITGPRQVGKSTLLEHISEGKYDYITFDDPILLEQAKSDPGLFMVSNSKDLILDEIQYVPELFPYLKMKMDSNKRKGMYLLTGSQAFSMMKNVSESLAGRIAILNLHGFSMREKKKIPFNRRFLPTERYLSDRESMLASYGTLWEDIHKGYMPALNTEDVDWRLYYASYVKTYIERDVRQLTQVADENLFLRFMVSLAARSGELLNHSSVAKDIGVSVDTVKRWTSILETSGIIYLLQPYSNNHLKRAIKTPKVYMMDTGLLAYLTKWLTPDVIRNGAKAGQFFETFVVSEIIKTYTNAGQIDAPLYYYRDKDGKEIDLIIEDGDMLYPIEIKMSASPVKSMASAFRVLKDDAGHKTAAGVILCQYQRKLWIDTDLVALPIEYI